MIWLISIGIIILLLFLYHAYENSMKVAAEKKAKINFNIFLTNNYKDIEYASFALAKYSQGGVWKTGLSVDEVYINKAKHSKIEKVIDESEKAGFGSYWVCKKLSSEAIKIRDKSFKNFLENNSHDLEEAISYLVSIRESFVGGICHTFEIEEATKSCDLITQLDLKASNGVFPNEMLYDYIEKLTNEKLEMIKIENDDEFKIFVNK
ncbi:hypothetical protein [Psychrobacter sp. DAB_AL43B]|uniref:hypothetical protein n=1 Tax=Psychrobacter sp. DAB_AL43B TaxID=1028416 RepID=UPI0009A763A0|nr:hypothetical protein [Psychrobacter sp. DAB_AL43B]SLJ85311.1 hypothetical protein DABAL43B_2125 [Psychrobacter sp. DAB_AL43B]